MTRSIIRIALATLAILAVPAIAMQVTDEVNWGPGDFLIMGALLFGTGLAYILISRQFAGRAARLVVGAGLATAFLLVWAQLAVGIF